MTEAKIWKKLRAQGKILLYGPDRFVIVTRHLDDTILDRIIHNKRQDYDKMYIKAAECEVLERALLGKKRIKP
jgi:hypothetical protein